VAALVAGVLLVVGAVGGFAWWRGAHGERRFVDDAGILRVTVPSSWARDVSLGGWRPPDSPYSQAALSIGDRSGWRSSGQGVFVGLMPEDKLPTRLPQHPACSSPGRDRESTSGDPTLTSVSTGCPGGAVIIERAVQVSASKLLWVQVRSRDQETAQRVLASVHTQGSLG
jgi:hypothetical protein